MNDNCNKSCTLLKDWYKTPFDVREATPSSDFHCDGAPATAARWDGQHNAISAPQGFVGVVERLERARDTDNAAQTPDGAGLVGIPGTPLPHTPTPDTPNQGDIPTEPDSAIIESSLEDEVIMNALSRLLTVDEFEAIADAARSSGNKLALQLITHTRLLAHRWATTQQTNREENARIRGQLEQVRGLLRQPRTKLNKSGLAQLLEQIGDVLGEN